MHPYGPSRGPCVTTTRRRHLAISTFDFLFLSSSFRSIFLSFTLSLSSRLAVGMTTMMAPPGSGQKGKHKDKGNETKAKQSGEKEYRLREQNQAKQMQQKRPRLDLSPNSRPKREPRKPATTLTQVMRRKHLVPAAPPTGYERRFQRLTTNGVGQGGVGVLKWEEHGKTGTSLLETQRDDEGC